MGITGKSSVFSHLHVSLHHLPGVICSIIKVLQVSLNLAHCAPHPQQVDVSVCQNRLCLLNALPADFHNLKRRTAIRKITQYQKKPFFFHLSDLIQYLMVVTI